MTKKPVDPKGKTYLHLLNILNCYIKEEGIAEKATFMLKQAFMHENKRSQESIQQDIKKLSVLLRKYVEIVGKIEIIQTEMNKLEKNLQHLITEKEPVAPTSWRRPFLEYQLDNLEYCIIKEHLTKLTKS